MTKIYFTRSFLILTGADSEGARGVQPNTVLTHNGKCWIHLISWDTVVTLNTHIPYSLYSRLSLSRIPRDSLKYFEISVLRHIRFAELSKN